VLPTQPLTKQQHSTMQSANVIVFCTIATKSAIEIKLL
jgi:hypothetical protein